MGPVAKNPPLRCLSVVCSQLLHLRHAFSALALVRRSADWRARKLGQVLRNVLNIWAVGLPTTWSQIFV